MSKFFLFLGIATICAAGAFTNGSFENNSGGVCNPGSGSLVTLSSGSTCITGWNVSQSDVDYLNHYWTNIDDGNYFLDMNGLQAGGIQQTFDVNNGHTYQVFFDLAGNPDGGSRTVSLQVTVAGVTNTYNFDTTGHSGSSLGWITESFTFNTALETSDTLTFTSQAGGAYGPLLDNVVLNDLGRTDATPEPSTFAALGLGIAGLAILRRRMLS